MSGLESLLEQLKQEGKLKLPLPDGFDAQLAHGNNQANKERLQILHAALEYGMPDQPGNVAVGGVGSLLCSLVGAQKKQTEIDARVIIPYYPNLHKDLKRSTFICSVQHLFKGQTVTSKIYKNINDHGIVQYWVQADDQHQNLFSALAYANLIYSDINKVSRFIERISYFCGAVAAFAMIGENRFLAHVVQGHSWGLCFLGKLINEYRKIYADGEQICSPYTLFTTHSVHDGDGTYDFAEVPDIGIVRSEKDISLTKEITDGYDHLVYVSEQLLKESILNPSSYSQNVFDRYVNGDASAILNNIYADQFDPAVCLPDQFKFDGKNIAAGKKKIRQYMNNTVLSKINKHILEDEEVTVFLGRFSEEKGIRRLKHAIEVTLNNGGTFICMGVGNHSVIRQLSAEYAKHPNVIFFTTAEQQKAYGKLVRCLASIFFVPSLMEACGLVPMEANLAYALVVASLVGGLVNVVKADANGMLFSDDESLRHSLDQVQKYLKELKRSGNLDMFMQLIQESARKSYDWHSATAGSAKSYKNLYHALGDRIAVNARMKNNETELSLAILQNNELEISRIFRMKEKLEMPNYIGLTPRELANRLNRFDLVSKIKSITSSQMTLAASKRRMLGENVVLLNMCFEYRHVKLGGVGETVTSLCDSINRKSNELGIEARVITPHYPWHDVLLQNGTLKTNHVTWTVQHLYCKQIINSIVTEVSAADQIQYLVRPANVQLANELFAKVTFDQAPAIYDRITPKLAYFNNAVAAFVTFGQANAPQIDVLNAHSWGCALTARILKDYYHSERPKTVLTVHSEFSEQGVIPGDHEDIEYLHGMGLRFMYGVDISPLTEGIAGTDHVVYVSEDLKKQAHKHTGPYSVRDLCRHYDSLEKSSSIINNISNNFNPENLGIDLTDMLAAKRIATQKINAMIQQNLPVNADETNCLAGKCLDENKHLTLCLGRILHEKGINNIDAAIEATLANGGSFAFMGLYGGMQEDDEIKRLAEKYQANPNVIILHEKSYIVQKKYGPLLRLAAKNAFIPSHRESCGLGSHEAQLNACFVTSSDVGGLNDTVKEGHTGFMYKNGKEGIINARRNTSEVVDAINRAYKHINKLAEDPIAFNKKLREMHLYSKANYVWEGENGSLVKYANLFKALELETNRGWDGQYPSLWDLPENCRNKLNLSVGDIYNRLPKNYVLQALGSQTIFEIEGYPHYLMRTSCNDIIGIFSNGKIGTEKHKIILGKGALGEVYLGQLLHSLSRPHLVGKFIAVKKQNLLTGSTAITQLRIEKNILTKLNSLILPYMETDAIDVNQKYLFLNIYEGKKLIESLKSNELSMRDKALVAAKLTEQLSDLHANSILHLDLHNRNVMVDLNSTIYKHDVKVKLIDFGASKIIAIGAESIHIQEFMQDAPQEVFEGIAGKYTDVYSLGVCLAELFLDELRQTRGEFLRTSCIGNLVSDRKASFFGSLPIPEFHSAKDKAFLQNIKRIICDMLNPDFKRRPTAKEAAALLRNLYEQFLCDSGKILLQDDGKQLSLELHEYLAVGGFNPEDLNQINQSGHTPLTYLYKNKHLYKYTTRREIARGLVKHGANVSHPNTYGLTAMRFAFERNNFVVNDLIDLIFLGADERQITIADLSLSANEENTLRMYIFHKQNRFGSFNPRCLNDLGYSPLTKAVHDNNLQMIKILVEADRGALQARSRYGYSALDIALERNYQEIIGYLQEQNCFNQELARSQSCSLIDDELMAVKLFLRNNNFNTELTNVNDYNISGHTPLTMAATLEQVNMCRLLVKLGAQINTPNAVGNIALHNAVDTGNEELIDCLLDLGSDTDFVNDNGYKPSQIAAEHKLKTLEEKLCKNSHRLVV